MVELANAMKHEMDLSAPLPLKPGEWHLPYIDTVRNAITGKLQHFVNGDEVSLEVAKTVSTSCCAQVSYRNLDKSVLKAIQIVARLADRDDPHLSPFEHQATPIQDSVEEDYLNLPGYSFNWEKGITHTSRDGEMWSGNFQGWIQNRQLMEV